MLRLSSSIDARRVVLADIGWVKSADHEGVTSADAEGVILPRRATHHLQRFRALGKIGKIDRDFLQSQTRKRADKKSKERA